MGRGQQAAHARRKRSSERCGRLLGPVGGVVHYLGFHINLLSWARLHRSLVRRHLAPVKHKIHANLPHVKANEWGFLANDDYADMINKLWFSVVP